MRRNNHINRTNTQRFDYRQTVFLMAKRRRQAENVRYSPMSFSLSDKLWIETAHVTSALFCLARATVSAEIAVEIFAA